LVKAVSQLLWTDKDREVPGFPVKFVGVDKLHAAFLNESRTRGRCLVPRTGNSGVWFSLEENHAKIRRFEPRNRLASFHAWVQCVVKQY
jgi:hypothetical protein